MNIKKKILALFIIFSIASFSTKAQDIINKESNFNNTQIKLSLSTLLYDNLRLYEFADKQLKSSAMLSGESSISVFKPLKNRYGINIGVSIGIIPYNLNYKFSTPENTPFNTGTIKYGILDMKFNDYSNQISSGFISFQKIYSTKGKNIVINLGVKLNKLIPYFTKGGDVYAIDDNTEIRLFDYFIKSIDNEYIVSYIAKIGLIKELKNNNSISLSLTANYSPKKISMGEYNFYELPTACYGQIGQNINYIGLEFSYGFSLK